MKQRLISAGVLAVILIPLVILGKLPFLIACIGLAILGMYEFININKKRKIPLVLQVISYLYIIAFIFLINSNIINVVYEYFLIGAFLLFFIPLVFIGNNIRYNIIDALYLFGGTIFICIAFSSFVVVRDLGLVNILYVLLIPIITDTFAIFSGMLIGKHKLDKSFSKNKTIEGCVIGSIVGTAIASLFYIYIINADINIFLIIGITLLLSIVGQIGDLFFSGIKRHFDIKDFSNLIPGHGGILDRFDSWIFTIITYLLFISLL